MESIEGAGTPPKVRRRVSLVFSYFEDVVYVGLALLLAYSAAALLITAVIALIRSAVHGAPVPEVIDLLDRSLLVLMINQPEGAFERAMIEVALLTVMVLALVLSLRLLRATKSGGTAKQN
jgi:hypothetical protein